MTTRALEHAPAGAGRSVVDVCLVDPRTGVDLTFPIFDPAAVRTVAHRLQDLGGPAGLDELNALMRRFVPARLDALARFGRAWSTANDEVRAARAACVDVGDDPMAVALAVLRLQGALRALREVISLDHDALEPGA